MDTTFEPRKKPRQQRSKAVVEAIVEAAARILATEGFTRLTTNHVAELAGVSIGSLYQYFPNKEAICHAVSERLFEDFTQTYLDALGEVVNEPLEQQIKALINVGLRLVTDFHVNTPTTYSEYDHFGGFDPLKKSRDILVPALTEMLRQEPEGQRPDNPGYVAYISLTAISEVLADVSFKHPEYLSDPVFVDHLYGFVIGFYLNAFRPSDTEIP